MMLSNFEKGFEMYIEAINHPKVNARYAPITRKLNEAICLMASDDMELMNTVVIGQWVKNRAFASPFKEKYGL